VLVTGAGGFIGSHPTERLISLGIRARAFAPHNPAGSWGMLDASPVKADIEVFSGHIRGGESLKKAM
jgi:uncharacterized protein YbjT (DUF2867 family)